MRKIIKILTIFQFIVLLTGCVTTTKHNITTKNINLKNSNILSTLKQNLNSNNTIADNNKSMLIQSKNYLKINFPNKTFSERSSIPIYSMEILKRLSDNLKKFPKIVVQINTYSNELPNKIENIDLANNRAFNIAEILDNFQVKNEIFARGYLSKNSKKLEIFLYEDIQNMTDHHQDY